MSMSNNTQPNAAPLNVTETFSVHEDSQFAVENSDVPEWVNSLDTQLKLGPSSTGKGKDPVCELNLTKTFFVYEYFQLAVDNSDLPEWVNSPDTQLKLGPSSTGKGKDPVCELNLTKTFFVYEDFQLAVDSSTMSMSNNAQPNAAPVTNVLELNLIDNLVGDVHDDVENIDVDTQLKLGPSTPLDTQLKLGPSRRHPVENTDVDTQLKLEFSKDPVENIDVSESVNSVDTQLSFSVHQDFPLPVEVAATTEAGDGAIHIPRKKRKISGDEGCYKWNERLMEDDIDTHAKIVPLEDLLMSPKSDDDLVEECHVTPTAAPELVVENGHMADAPENGGLRRSTRPRKPNTRLKGYELYDPKMGYYLNE